MYEIIWVQKEEGLTVPLDMTHHSVFGIKLDGQIRVFHLEKEELERGGRHILTLERSLGFALFSQHLMNFEY